MLLLDTISFNPDLTFELLSTLVIVLTGAGFFFKSRSQVELIKNDLENTKANLSDLKKSVSDTYSKIENKISELETKINELPKNIIELFNQLK